MSNYLNKTLKFLTILIFLFLFAPISKAYAASYYVSTTGSDTNIGALSNPFKTVQKAVNTVAPGDTVYVLAGTYNESVNVQRTGTSTGPIKLTNYNGQVVIINGGSNPALLIANSLPQYWIVQGLKFYSTNNVTIKYNSWACDGTCNGIDHWTFQNNFISGAVEIYGAYTLFEGNEVDGTLNNGGGGNGVHDYYDVSHHNTFRNNTVHGFSLRGFWSMHKTHDNLFEGNTVYDIGVGTTNYGYGIDTDGYANVEWRHIIRNNLLYNVPVGIDLENCFATIVENNIVHDSKFSGIFVENYGATYSGGATNTSRCTIGGENNQYGDIDGNNDCEGNITNNIVRQNLVYNAADGSGLTVYLAGGVSVLGNTFVNNKVGIHITNDTSQLVMKSNITANNSMAELIGQDFTVIANESNNLFWNITSNKFFRQRNTGTLSTFVQYKTATGKGLTSVFADPKLNSSYHLLANSPAINTGVDIGLSSDLGGISRPQGAGYDIGAYEYVGGTTTTIAPTIIPTIVPTLVPSPSFKPGDANKDGSVNETDFSIWLVNFNKSTSLGLSAGDFNSDNFVNGIDYVIWLNNYGK